MSEGNIATEQVGPLMCACKPFGPVHVWEPGERCNPVLVEPTPAQKAEQGWQAFEQRPEMIEIREHLPGLHYERSKFARAGLTPTHVMIPARLKVRFDGEDATDCEASCLGFPVLWQDDERWGFAFVQPSPFRGGGVDA